VRIRVAEDEEASAAGESEALAADVSEVLDVVDGWAPASDMYVYGTVLRWALLNACCDV
jgi:hypothetical protein